jgi:hypothetical protein
MFPCPAQHSHAHPVCCVFRVLQLGLWLPFNPMPLIIWVAIIIEIGLQNWPDVGVLLAIQFINATLGW